MCDDIPGLPPGHSAGQGSGQLRGLTGSCSFLRSLTLPRPPIRIPEELAKELASGPVASERVEPVRFGLREEHGHANGPLFLRTAISLRGRHRLPESFAPALASMCLFPLHQLEGREL